MPTRNISLTPEQDAFIDEALKAGEYSDASEAIRDAVRALQQRRADPALSSLRAKRSNPVFSSGPWIASSLRSSQ